MRNINVKFVKFGPVVQREMSLKEKFRNGRTNTDHNSSP